MKGDITPQRGPPWEAAARQRLSTWIVSVRYSYPPRYLGPPSPGAPPPGRPPLAGGGGIKDLDGDPIVLAPWVRGGWDRVKKIPLRQKLLVSPRGQQRSTESPHRELWSDGAAQAHSEGNWTYSALCPAPKGAKSGKPGESAIASQTSPFANSRSVC